MKNALCLLYSFFVRISAVIVVAFSLAGFLEAASGLDTGSSGESQAVAAKAQSIRIPYIEFRDATFREAVDILREQGEENDTGGTGVNISIELNDTSPNASPIPRITLLLQDVTLFQAVTAVAQQTGLSVRAESYGLVIYRKKE